MFNILKGFDTKLEDCLNHYEIYSYERIILRTQERKLITLPICKEFEPGRRYIHFELDKNLILNGLQCLYTNINDGSFYLNMQLVLFNSNLDYSVINGTQSPLNQIIGSRDKIDIISNTLLGRIYIN